jgi:hypothetical protein
MPTITGSNLKISGQPPRVGVMQLPYIVNTEDIVTIILADDAEITVIEEQSVTMFVSSEIESNETTDIIISGDT